MPTPITDPAYLVDLLQNILDVSCVCLEDTPQGAPQYCFVSHGVPPDDCCFASETEVVTSTGVHPIRDLAGSMVELMTTDGEWVKAPVRSFGHQRLWGVTLTRDGREKVVRATGNHRWLLDQRHTSSRKRNLIERDTAELRPGDILASETGVTYEGPIDDDGIRAGIVFGDGTVEGPSAHVLLYGEKQSLASYFEFVTQPESGGTRCGRLPAEWKSLPDAGRDLPWLAGWLAGYIATDGSVNAKRGSVRLSSSKRGHLDRVREVCYRLGIITSVPTVQSRTGFGSEPTDLWQISLHPSSIPDWLFVRADQACAFIASERMPSRWRVKSVVETDDVEEVFCATVSDTRAFVLADNILTGNCDFLTVWLVRQYPTQTFPAWKDSASKPCEPVRAAIEIEVRLVRPCYPVLQDNAQDPFPPPPLIDAAAKDLLIDARVLWCCLQRAFDEGEFYPPDMECLDVKWGEMMFHGPQGGCAGWKWRITLEGEPCC
jgi:hypothetical protein